jgi:hypothetical protein
MAIYPMVPAAMISINIEKEKIRCRGPTIDYPKKFATYLVNGLIIVIFYQRIKAFF